MATIHFTLVGSDFHDSFVDKLKFKPQEYTYTKALSFNEYKAPEGHDTHVVVLNGHDDGLAKATTLAALLDQSIILAFFAPSKDILFALHKAANSLISIPSIELEDGTPIIIHRCPHDGVISITPGFNIPTRSPTNYVQGASGGNEGLGVATIDPKLAPTILSPEEKVALNSVRSVDIIRLTVEYHLELRHGDPAQFMEEDGLTPPQGTNYHKTTELSEVWTACGGESDTFHNHNTDQRWDYIARLRLHAYCADAKPTDADFAKNGGMVYVLAVLSGQLARDPKHDPRTFDPDATGPKEMHWFVDSTSYQLSQPEGGSLRAVKAEPQVGQTSQEVTTYNINYGINLNLWTGAGSRKFPFSVKYGDSFSLTQFKQKVQGQNQGDYNVSIYYDYYYNKSVGQVPYDGGWEEVFRDDKIRPFPEDNIPLNALFVWTSSSLTEQVIAFNSEVTHVGFMRNYNGHHWIAYGKSTCFKRHTLDLAKWD